MSNPYFIDDHMNVIHTYTRKAALKDGVLIDVSRTAREAGFKVPVAVARTIYEKYLSPSEELKSLGQSSSGRLWDLLCCLYFCAKGSQSSEIRFPIAFQMIPSDLPVDFVLKAIISGGDDGKPVITIMGLDED